MKHTIRVGGRTGTAHTPTAYEWGTSLPWARSVTVDPHDFSRGRMSEWAVRTVYRQRRSVLGGIANGRVSGMRSRSAVAFLIPGPLLATVTRTQCVSATTWG